MTKETYRLTQESRMRNLAKTFNDRFMSRVDRSEIYNGCWLWVGTRNEYGYGTVYRGRPMLTHRVSWEMHRGKIPDGLLVLHRCDTPPCCNPDHLFLGTHKDNAQDMIKKGRKAKPTLGKKCDDAPNRKLNSNQVKDIRLLISKGISQRRIAIVHGVSQACISNIANRKTW